MSSYQLNKLLYELKDAERVKESLKNPQGLLANYRLSPEEIEALESEDLTALFRLGANPYMIRNVYRSRYRY
jgi:hypothetical protein